MISIWGALSGAPWPTWLGAGLLVCVSIGGRLVAERARRRTYQEILTRCPEGTVLVDVDRRRYLLLCRPVTARPTHPVAH